MTNCPNCDTKLKGMLSEVRMYDSHKVNFIKDFTNFNGDDLCEKCGKLLLKEARSNYIHDNNSMKEFLQEYRSTFPIVTIQNPKDWDYETIGIVTAQATMDNRVENKSIFDILTGANDNVVDLDSSVNTGEKICFEVMRQKSYLLGGNAILGVDIDYSEFGLKGELMLVCMAGTAINLKNLDQISESFMNIKTEYNLVERKLEMLEEYSDLVKK